MSKPRIRVPAWSRPHVAEVARFPIELVRDDLSIPPSLVLDDALSEPLARVVVIGETYDARELMWTNVGRAEAALMLLRASARLGKTRPEPVRASAPAAVLPFPGMTP